MTVAIATANGFAQLNLARIDREIIMRRFSLVTSCMVAACGLLVLSGWMFHIAVLKSIVPGFLPMTANGAVGFILVGTSLGLLQYKEPREVLRFVRLLGAFTLLLGVVTLAEYIFGRDLYFDEVLFTDVATASSTLANRMAPATALNFILLGIVLLLRKRKLPITQQVSDALLLLVAVIGLTPLNAYRYDVSALSPHGMFSAVALNTTLLFLAVSAAGLAASPSTGIAALLAGGGPGALLARRFLPVALTVPTLIGWLQLIGEHQSLYGAEFGLVLSATTNAIIFVIVILWAALSLRTADLRRGESVTALRTSEQRILELVENVPEYAILMLDPQGHVLTWNAGAERVKGYEAKEILGQHFSRFYTPEDIAEHKPEAKLKRALEEGKYEDEGWRVRKDGSRFWANMIISPLLDSGGQLRGFCKITRDITARNSAQVEREKNEHRLRLIIDNLSVGLIVANMQGDLLHWNERAQTMFGLSTLKERLHKTPALANAFELSTLDGCVLEVEQWPLARVIGGERLRNLELRLLRLDTGQQLVLSFSGSIAKDEFNEASAFLSFADITERVQVERELRASEQRYRFLADTMPQILWTSKPDGNLDYYNGRWFDYTGVTSEETQNVGWKSLLHPDDLESCVERWTKSFMTGCDYDFECRLKRAVDGAFRWHLCRAFPMRKSSGEIIQWVGTCTDIHDQKHAEETLREARNSLELRVIERTSELTATLKEREVLLQEIHHRVKNNLQVISSLMNMQIRKLRDAPGRDALEECKARVASIALIHEKLYQSRDYASVPFSDYAKSLAANIFHATGVSAAHIILNVDMQTVTLPVDKAIPLGLILNELITNALKHAFPKERSGSVCVELHKLDSTLRLSVKDDGIGTPIDIDPAKSKSLGLQLVATLAEQLDGRLEITRAAGTTVSVTFSVES